MCWQEGWEKVVLSSWQTRHVTCGGTQWAFERLRGETFEIGALRAEQGGRHVSGMHSVSPAPRAMTT